MPIKKNPTEDIKFIKQTLKLAKKGSSFTAPNPMVGAVIVKNGKIIGQGYHKKYGGDHAEIEALKSAKTNVVGATMYISLEPCSHFGKTPPCANAVIKAGIKKIICCTMDPNPKVAGQGLKKLNDAGIETVLGILSQEARDLNESFFTYHEKKRPFVVIKFATSLDGKIATKDGESKWITNETARQYARGLRERYQSILVGINTVLADDPNLGAQNKNQKDPLRIILDPSLQIPLKCQVLRDKNILIFTSQVADKNKLAKLQKLGYTVVQFKNKQITIKQILAELYKRKIHSVFVEGGSQTIGNFVDAKLVDKIYSFHAPIIIGGHKSIPAIGGEGIKKLKTALQIVEPQFKIFGDNFLIFGKTT
ncbi:MAG: Riboflavin biosynthesis protein RibD [uncultured bacterium]|nr:MAG: Riboflavin biosynthesis protein RibD [uncultured bacterium]